MSLLWPLTKGQIGHYHREGWLLVEGVLDAADLAGLREAIHEVTAAARAGAIDGGFIELEPADTGTPALRRIIDPYARHEAFRVVAHDPRVVDRVESLLGPDLDLHHSKLNCKPARVGSPVKWHQDLAYYPHSNDGVLAVLIYLRDASEANGCLQVLPRRHHAYLDHSTPSRAFAGRVVDEADIDTAPRALAGPAGSAVFLHGLTPHSSLPNLSKSDRPTLIFAYRAGDAYPLYYGAVMVEDEAVQRPVRGRRSRHARFGGPPPIVPRIDDTSSLYEIQAADVAGLETG